MPTPGGRMVVVPAAGAELAPQGRSPDNGRLPCRLGRFAPAVRPLLAVPRAACSGLNMKIEKDRVVSFHYTVSEVGQEPIESSRDRDPLVILIGHGNIIPGLETAMQDKEAGASFSVDVPASDAYGEYREGLQQRIPKKHFGDAKLQPGQQVVLQTNFGPRAVTVKKVGMSVVDVDLNHPMAGKDLHFDVEIVDVREATPEEAEHGHVHGEGGHHH